jgi:hypothetical protein
MACLEGVELGLEALTIAAGMDLVANVEEVESGQPGGRVADSVVGRMSGFDAEIVACSTHERGVTEVRDFGHFAQPHIGAHRDDAGEELPWIGLVFDVPGRAHA